MLTLRFVTTLCTTTLLTAIHLSAYAAPDAVELKSVAEKEIIVMKNGKQETKRVAVDVAVPGDEIVYTTTFKNLLNKPTGDIVITNPIPNDSFYKGGSAAGVNTVITFSVDSGKQFASPEKLTVKTTDGKTRPALPADYTHIRWTYQGELGIGKTGAVSFRTTIK